MKPRKGFLITGMLAVLSIGLSACGHLLSRSWESGYSESASVNQQEINDFYEERQLHRMEQAKSELGLMSTQPLSERELYYLNNHLHLQNLEKKLQSKREKNQYYRYKPLLRSDLERIQFLRIPTIEGRERWAQYHQVPERATKFSPTTAQMIESNDIIVGMNRPAVLESWGEPDAVEVSGNPVYGNERWKYHKMVSSDNGYNKELRVIYFESGLVAGWEKY